MAGDDEQIAADPLPAGRGQPIGPSALHQFDKLILIVGQAAPESISFSSAELTVMVQTVRLSAKASAPQPMASAATRRKILADKDIGGMRGIVCKLLSTMTA